MTSYIAEKVHQRRGYQNFRSYFHKGKVQTARKFTFNYIVKFPYFCTAIKYDMEYAHQGVERVTSDGRAARSPMMESKEKVNSICGKAGRKIAGLSVKTFCHDENAYLKTGRLDDIRTRQGQYLKFKFKKTFLANHR